MVWVMAQSKKLKKSKEKAKNNLRQQAELQNLEEDCLAAKHGRIKNSLVNRY